MCIFCDRRKGYCPRLIRWSRSFCDPFSSWCLSMQLAVWLGGIKNSLAMYCAAPAWSAPGYSVFDFRDSNHMSNSRVTCTKSKHFFWFLLSNHPVSSVTTNIDHTSNTLSLDNTRVFKQYIHTFSRHLCDSYRKIRSQIMRFTKRVFSLCLPPSPPKKLLWIFVDFFLSTNSTTVENTCIFIWMKSPTYNMSIRFSFFTSF